MKILAIGGAPGVGKSTLMTTLLSAAAELQYARRGRHGLLDYMEFQAGAGRKVFVLGYYPPGEVFGGTDRLSMAVQPDAVDFIRQQVDSLDDPVVVFEGDRLFNASFLSACEATGAHVKVVVLDAPDAALHARRTSRANDVGKAQDATWLAGRRTKVENVAKVAAMWGLLERVSVLDLAATHTAAQQLRTWMLAS